MQKLWFLGPLWYKGRIIKSPKQVPTPFRKEPERVPERITERIVSTETWLKYKTRYK